jgi:hypothetical protein
MPITTSAAFCQSTSTTPKEVDPWQWCCGPARRRFVNNLEQGSPEWIYDSLYCARGQAENLIKLHKSQLASDRTSCRSAVANQVRLILHTAAAYWLMLTVRDAIIKQRDLAKAEFATLRLRLLKIAARVVETASRVRLAFGLSSGRRHVRQLARRARPARTLTDGASAPFARPSPPARDQQYRSLGGEKDERSLAPEIQPLANRGKIPTFTNTSG